MASNLSDSNTSPTTSSDKAGGSSGRLTALGLLSGLLVLITIGLLFYQGQQATTATLYIASAGELQTLSQQIAKSGQLAIQGREAGFTELQQARNRFAALLEGLTSGGQVSGGQVPPSPASVAPQLAALEEIWLRSSRDAQQLLSQQATLTTLNQSVDTINAHNALLLDLAEEIAALHLQSDADLFDVASANTLVMLTQRLAKNVNSLQVSAAIDPEVAFLVGKDTNSFRDIIAELTQSTRDFEIREKLRELDTASAETFGAISNILGNMQFLVQAKQAGTRLFEDSSELLVRTRNLSTAYESEFGGIGVATLGAGASGALAVLFLALLAGAYRKDVAVRHQEDERKRLMAEEERNQSQEAILRLMNEMGDLADGDLTVRATVTEDITGAIADSVNYTIEELSVLVRRINDAAGKVTEATETAQNTSSELLDATERQTREIEQAGETVQRMAQSMTNAAQRALESAQVARRSRDAAQKGTQAVENTIKGMQGIREQIQETSKRIKRLGESSQEIGEIVELISDITEQTNVLALNAAIQAASAGEAGRGFTVVAEEVQRLAERSAEATKQISAIVKTIQTDTKDAVGAMENATRDVVEGAALSDAAGQALAEIDSVSSETAQLIEQISTDIQQQASTAGRVANTMKDILAITEQTTRGTEQTAVSIGELSDLAVELKGSVSGFRV